MDNLKWVLMSVIASALIVVGTSAFEFTFSTFDVPGATDVCIGYQPAG